MIVRRVSTLLCALLLGLTCAYAVACGEDEEGLLSAGRAEGIKDNLDDLDRAVARGDCPVAASQIEDLQGQIARLPEDTDRGLRRRLQQGVEHLATISPTECEEVGQSTTETETTPTETTPTETIPPTETTPPPTETTPTETTPPPTETTPPPTETTPPPDTTPTAPPETPPGGEEAPGVDG